MNGINFVLRGGDEHRNLKLSQLTPNLEIGVMYFFLSYTCQSFQTVQCTFYMKPKDRIPESPGDSWYANTPLGHNTLGKFLKEILKEGHVQAENKSNHNLWSTAITRMFENKVPIDLFWKGLVICQWVGCTHMNIVPWLKCKMCASHYRVYQVQRMMLKIVAKRVLQDDATEVLHNMQFMNMSGCTFNFTLRWQLSYWTKDCHVKLRKLHCKLSNCINYCMYYTHACIVCLGQITMIMEYSSWLACSKWQEFRA